MTRFVHSLLLSLLLCCFALRPAAAQRVSLDYGVWAGGFQALDVALDITVNKDSYRATMTAHPTGFLGKLLPWAGDYRTEGVVRNGVLIPTFHERMSAWRDDRSYLRIFFSKGRVSRVEEIETFAGKKQTVPRPQPPGMTDGAVDIMTAIVGMLLHATDKGNCDYRAVAFDGKRRFRVGFKDLGIETLPVSQRNVFSNVPARTCELELTALMGFSGRPRGYYKIQEEARTLGQLPRVWLGRMNANGPYILGRMLVKSEYGAVFVHLEHMMDK